jgi:hypothetical protein
MNNNLILLATKLLAFNRLFENKKYRFILNNSVYTSKFLYFYYFISAKEFEDSPYRSLLLNYFSKAENYYPGCSYFVSKKLCNLILNKNNIVSIKPTKDIDTIFDYLSTLASKNTFLRFKDILEFSGADGVITCEKTQNSQCSVEKSCNPTFPISIDFGFEKVYFSNVTKTTKDFIFSIVDGFIERESELYSLIEYAKEEKLPCVLICRGIADMAKQNIRQIMLANNVFIYPYIAKYNEEDPFLLKDIASTIESGIIAAEYSDNIQKDIVSKTKIVKASLKKDKIIFYTSNKDLQDDINKQIKFADSSGHEQKVKKYLYKRKARCSPNNIIVRIPENDLNFLQTLKNLILCFNFCALKGVFKNDKLQLQSVQCENMSSILSSKLYGSIKNLAYVVKIKK